MCQATHGSAGCRAAAAKRRAVAAVAQMDARPAKDTGWRCRPVRVEALEHADSLSLTSCKLAQIGARQRRRGRKHGRQVAHCGVRAGGRAVRRGRAGAGAEAGRHPQDLSPRQPGQHVDPRGGDASPSIAPMMGVFNNLVIYDQHVAQNSLQRHRPRPRRRAGRGTTTARTLTFKLRHGVKWHDGKPFTAADVKCTWDLLTGKGERQVAAQPAQSLVGEPRRGHRQRRRRGDVPSEAAAAGVSGAARLGLFAGLSVPRPAGADAPAPDRHRPVQVRRVQAQRVHQAGARTRITGSRAGPISTASSTRSSPTARPRSSPLSPASST